MVHASNLYAFTLPASAATHDVIRYVITGSALSLRYQLTCTVTSLNLQSLDADSSLCVAHILIFTADMFWSIRAIATRLPPYDEYVKGDV